MVSPSTRECQLIAPCLLRYLRYKLQHDAPVILGELVALRPGYCTNAYQNARVVQRFHFISLSPFSEAVERATTRTRWYVPSRYVARAGRFLCVRCKMLCVNCLNGLDRWLPENEGRHAVPTSKNDLKDRVARYRQIKISANRQRVRRTISIPA